MLQSWTRSLYAAALLLLGAGAASATEMVIDFEDLDRGEIVSTQYFASLGVTITGTHLGGGPNAAIIFDTLFGGPVDADLQGPDWAGGNLETERLGNVLIIPENVTDVGSDGFVDLPDDEGDRPAGVLTFLFEMPITSFGLDLLDVEPPAEAGFLTFFDASGQVGMISFEDLALAGDMVAFGDNTANRMPSVLASSFDGVRSFVKVEVLLGGSSAVDNVRFTPVPEPATLSLIGAALSSLAWRRRRARRNQSGSM